MKRFLLPLSVIGAVMFNAGQAAASRMSGFLGLSVGSYALFADDDDRAIDLRAEYRPEISLVFKQVKPWAGIDVSSNAALWVGGGFLIDLKMSDHFYITPSLGAGYYNSGHGDIDLDFPLIFRSQLELGYQFDSGSRLAVSFSHMSNCSLGDSNPGVEMLNLYYHIPLERLFGGLDT